MQIKVEELANPWSYNNLAEEVESTRLIMSGNGKQPSNLSKDSLEREELEKLESSDGSLMDVALLYGDLDAIQTLVNSGRFNDDEVTYNDILKCFLLSVHLYGQTIWRRMLMMMSLTFLGCRENLPLSIII